MKNVLRRNTRAAVDRLSGLAVERQTARRFRSEIELGAVADAGRSDRRMNFVFDRHRTSPCLFSVSNNNQPRRDTDNTVSWFRLNKYWDAAAQDRHYHPG